MKLLSRIPAWILNKYLLTGIFFVVWMVFFDDKDIGSDLVKRERLLELQKSEKQLTKAIKDSRNELVLLKTNAQTIEKYAREKYMMKKDNEDLFIVKSRPSGY
jgi:cell division protein DivIC